jgi:hypothetical protein
MVLVNSSFGGFWLYCFTLVDYDILIPPTPCCLSFLYLLNLVFYGACLSLKILQSSLLTTMAHLPVYIPNFLKEELASGDDLIDIRDHLQCINWLTYGLVDGITSLFPTQSDIDSMTGSSNQTSFSENCLKFSCSRRNPSLLVQNRSSRHQECS